MDIVTFSFFANIAMYIIGSFVLFVLYRRLFDAKKAYRTGKAVRLVVAFFTVFLVMVFLSSLIATITIAMTPKLDLSMIGK